MAIQTGGAQNGLFAAINITPLTDIFLVLLIIFMVATAVTIESAAHVELPHVAAATPSEAHGITVTYTAEHQILVNQRWVAETALPRVLHDALATSPLKLVVFDGDPKVILGDAVRIIGIAKQAGAEQIALAVAPTSGPPGSEAPTGSPPAATIPGAGPIPETVAPLSGP